MKCFTYLARCNDQSLYVGSCKDIQARELKHNKGEGSLYTKQRLPVKIIYTETYGNLTDARRREKQIKGWSRIKKENLVKYGHPTKVSFKFMPHTKEAIKEYILRSIENLDPIDDTEIQDKKRIKNHLVLHPNNFYDRKNFQGHITVNGLIFSEDGKVLLIKHAKLGQWIAPGGHCDEGEMPYEAAVREVGEETGITELKPRHKDETNNVPIPFFVSIHSIPEYGDEKEHQHLNLLYVFDTKQTEIAANHETNGAKWFAKEEAKKVDPILKKIFLKLMGKIIM